MIKEKEIEVMITRRNITYYKNIGYECKNINNKIWIDVNDIYPSSRTKITAICENCDSENYIQMNKYTKNKERGGYYGCRSCSRIKFKKTNMNKYGVDNPMKVDEIKNKTFNTNMEKYGVKSTLQSEECNPHFYSSISNKELDILNFIKENYDGKIIGSDRTVLDGLELDIYLPDLNIAFEFDGIYWHNEINKPDKKYHLNKTNKCLEKNIQLVHIFEDEWIEREDTVKSIILNKLRLSKHRIYGRKTKLKEIETKQAKQFFEENHIQGYTNSSVKLGLFYNDELVSAMLFTKKTVGGRISFDGYELSRFVNKKYTNVIGAASKLLKWFEIVYNPKEIRSYADRRWFDGGLYNILGFTQTHINSISYWYVIGEKRKHKSSFTKSKIEKQGFSIIGKTEHELMLERKIYRIYDCGTIAYSKKY